MNQATTLLLALLMILSSCGGGSSSSSGSSGDGGGGGEQPPVRRFYLTFSTTCGAIPRPVVVGVTVFDESTRQAVVRGNTNGDGAFHSVVSLDERKSYRIEFSELPRQRCFQWVKNVSVARNGNLFTERPLITADPPVASFHFGEMCAGWTPLTDCWHNSSSGGPPRTFVAADDVYVYAPDPDENYNDGSSSCRTCGDALKLVPVDGHEGEARILLRYDLGRVPVGAVLDSASIGLRDLGGSVNNSSSSVTLTVHRVTRFWREEGPTWNDQPAFDPTVLGAGVLNNRSFNVVVEVDVSLLRAWVDGTVPNYGLVLVPVGGSAPLY